MVFCVALPEGSRIIMEKCMATFLWWQKWKGCSTTSNGSKREVHMCVHRGKYGWCSCELLVCEGGGLLLVQLGGRKWRREGEVEGLHWMRPVSFKNIELTTFVLSFLSRIRRKYYPLVYLHRIRRWSKTKQLSWFILNVLILKNTWWQKMFGCSVFWTWHWKSKKMGGRGGGGCSTQYSVGIYQGPKLNTCHIFPQCS